MVDSSKICNDFPEWAQKLVSQLLLVETHLGNIPKDLVWKSDKVISIHEKAFFAHEGLITEELAENLFKKLVIGLSRDSYTVEQINRFINIHLSSGGMLPYCDTKEIHALL